MSREDGPVTKVLATIAFLFVAYIATGILVPDLIGNQMVIRSAELRWSAPTIVPGNGPDAELAGYTVYCWNVAYHSVEEVRIDDTASTYYNLDTLPPGTYQCAVQAVLEDGSTSALSNVVTRIVP